MASNVMAVKMTGRFLKLGIRVSRSVAGSAFSARLFIIMTCQRNDQTTEETTQNNVPPRNRHRAGMGVIGANVSFRRQGSSDTPPAQLRNALRVALLELSQAIQKIPSRRFIR
jgi:hypothetical protein